MNEIKTVGLARLHLQEAELRLAENDYEGALLESQEALSWTSDPHLKDQALFNMAIVYSHEKSHYKDHQKAVKIFKRLLESDPKSPFAQYAEMWISLRQNNAELAVENTSLVNENTSLSDENSTLTETNRKLRHIIERMKQVDLEIEQKRRN